MTPTPQDQPPLPRYRFGLFEADAATGELRRQGVRIRLNAQPFQVLLLLLERPGQLLTREEIAAHLWPDGTFVDFDHGVNSAINRIREALGDTAANPLFIETLARRGYRFLAPVTASTPPQPPTEIPPPPPTFPPPNPAATRPTPGHLPGDPVPDTTAAPDHALFLAALLANPSSKTPADPSAKPPTSPFANPLSTEADLPKTPHRTVQLLFTLLQLMYLGFYIGALANLAEIEDLLAPLPHFTQVLIALITTATILIPVRAFVLSLILFHAPNARHKFLKIWPALLLADLLWSLAPTLLLHHISLGLALACTALLLYSPFAQRSLVLMGAGQAE